MGSIHPQFLINQTVGPGQTQGVFMRRIAMEKAKEILELSLKMGLSQRDVARGTGCCY